MTTYVFKCLKCGQVADHSMSMKTVAYTLKLKCPNCKVRTLQTQKLEVVPVHFKGTGWPDKER